MVDFTCMWRPRADRSLAQGLMNCFEQIKRPSAHRLLAASRISLSLYMKVLSAGDKAKSQWFKIQGTEAALSMQQTYKQSFGKKKKREKKDLVYDRYCGINEDGSPLVPVQWWISDNLFKRLWLFLDHRENSKRFRSIFLKLKCVIFQCKKPIFYYFNLK